VARRGLTLDTGALIAAEKRARSFWALWERALELRAPVTIPAAVLGQVWRGNSPVVARLLASCNVENLDETAAKRAGELLAASRTSDVVDASVVVGAAARGDTILTSDPEDIARLVAVLGKPVQVVTL